MVKEKLVYRTIRLSESLEKQVDDIAKAEGLNFCIIVRQLLSNYVLMKTTPKRKKQ